MKLPRGHETNLRERVKDSVAQVSPKPYAEFGAAVPPYSPTALGQLEPVAAALKAAPASVEAIPAFVPDQGREGKKPPQLVRLSWDLLPV